MKRIKPKDFYLDLPCSVVSIGCASETLHGSFDYGKIKVFSEIASANDNYATLRSVNGEIRKLFNVRKYVYFKRTDRVTLKEMCERLKTKDGFNAIVCVLGHFLYVHNNTYYSFFNNEDDKVVAMWLLD